ncbi:MAG: HAD-IIIA family hydrolase [Anaerolineaceae bacterium]|nr:HAD-IIIA family hydrolase [Anaerolineaceae bacterium]
MKAVIMAGGRGTRIASIAGKIPKPMIRIGEKPVLEHEIECLREQGITEIILTVSYLSELIKDYFGDGSGISPATGKPFDVQISYYDEKEPLGNAGALFEIRDQLTDDFLLLNADSLFHVDFGRFIEAHRHFGGLATLFTHPNSHPYDSGLIIADKNNAVMHWLAKEDVRPRYYRNRVNAGLHILSPKLLKTRPDTPKVDLDRQILKPLSGTGKLFCYDSPEYVKDMGTPERYAAVCEDYRSGLIQAKDLRNQQKAIFLDRDGTINRYVGFLRDINDFELLPDTAEAIRQINTSGYLAIVITNQPVIARGEVSPEQLEEIHNKMETLLGQEGAYLDAIYYCPHHPDKGFPGEIPELKINCDCRKPKPGMLIKAAEDFNIDLTASWMIGDGKNDVRVGENAGCQTALISPVEKDFGQALTASDLLTATSTILGKD